MHRCHRRQRSPGSRAAFCGAALDQPMVTDDEIQWHIVNDPDGVPVCVFGPHPADWVMADPEGNEFCAFE